MDSPLFRIRFSLDDMPNVTADDQEALAERLEDVPAALAGLRQSLELGRNSGLTAPLRQVLASADAVDGWIEHEVFRVLGVGGRDPVLKTLAARLDAATAGAAAALADGSRPALVWIAGGDGPHDVDYEQTVIFHSRSEAITSKLCSSAAQPPSAGSNVACMCRATLRAGASMPNASRRRWASSTPPRPDLAAADHKVCGTRPC